MSIVCNFEIKSQILVDPLKHKLWIFKNGLNTMAISIFNPLFNGSTPAILSVYTSLNISNRIPIRPGIPSYISGIFREQESILIDQRILHNYRHNNGVKGHPQKNNLKFLKSAGLNWPSQKCALKILEIWRFKLAKSEMCFKNFWNLHI